jgi:hypothetical protein
MPNANDLRQWLINNLDDLRVRPDMITPAAHNTLRFRWHGVAQIHGAMYGIGANLHDGPALGGIWLYGHGVAGVALHPYANPRIPMHIRPHLLGILQGHGNNHAYEAEQNEWLQGLMGMGDVYG